MRALGTYWQQATAASVTHFAYCCKIMRRDGVVIGFTGYDQPLVIDEVSYEPGNGFQYTALEQRVDLKPDSLDIQAIVDDERITKDDLMNGVYDAAVVEIFLVDYTAIEQGKIVLATGLIRSIKLEEDLFVAEIDGLNSQLYQAHLDLYTPTCRVRQLGDARCKVNTKPYETLYSVEMLDNAYTFQVGDSLQDDQYYQYGVISWKSGENAGTQSVVKNFVDNTFELVEPPVYFI